MRDENDGSDWNSNDSEDDSTKETIDAAAGWEQRNDAVDAEIHALTLHDDTQWKKGNKRKKQLPKCQKAQRQLFKQYPDEINDLYEYIQGKKTWKKVRLNKTDTVITKDHPEKAKNKPIIWGKCDGHDVKFFLDTGAEINVIDSTFLRTLNIPQGKINKEKKVIRCANDTRMDTQGWITLRIGAAERVRQCKFWVVDQLFPKVIIGIRGMKDLKMAVDPAKNCVWVNKVKIPMLSRIHKQSICRQSEN